MIQVDSIDAGTPITGRRWTGGELHVVVPHDMALGRLNAWLSRLRLHVDPGVRVLVSVPLGSDTAFHAGIGCA